jgi:hypothetical protein
MILCPKLDLSQWNLFQNFSDVRIGLSDGGIFDPNNTSSFFFRPNICVLSLPISKDYCFYYISGEDHLILPEGAKKYDSSRNVYGCGLVLDPENKLAIFFTSNGMLIGSFFYYFFGKSRNFPSN